MIDSSSLLLLLLVIAPGPVLIGFITLPRWYFRSMHLHDLLELREEEIDDILTDRLPLSHPAVEQLARRAEATARNCKRMSIFDMRVLQMILRREQEVPRSVRAAARVRPLDGLNKQQRELVVAYRERLVNLYVGTMLLGSWLGLAAIIRVVAAEVVLALRNALRRRQLPPHPFRALGDAWWAAIEKAIGGTRRGRRTTEIVRDQGALNALNA